MTRAQAHEALRTLAASVFEVDEEQAAVRLMERVSGHESPEVLRDALAELGARTVLRESLRA